MISLVRCLGAFAVLAAVTAQGGPLGFEDLGLVQAERAVVDCGSCAFVTSFEPIQLATDGRDTIFIILWMATLGLIGVAGVYFRVRVKR